MIEASYGTYPPFSPAPVFNAFCPSASLLDSSITSLIFLSPIFFKSTLKTAFTGNLPASIKPFTMFSPPSILLARPSTITASPDSLSNKLYSPPPNA